MPIKEAAIPTSRSLERPSPCEQHTKSAYCAHEAPMGKWPGCYTSTGQDGSKEIALEWIGPVVAEFVQHLQDPRSPYHAHGHIPLGSDGVNHHDVAHLRTKTVPMNLIWRESAQWLLSSDICRIPGALITPMDMPIMPPWTHDHDVAHLHAKAVQINLIRSEPAQWLLISSIRKIPGALILPMGTPVMPPWANNHYTAHLHVMTASMGLISSESAQRLLCSGVRKILRAFIKPMGRPIIPPSSPWANYHKVAHLQAKAVPMNLIWCESAQWLLSYGIRKIRAGRTDGRTDERTNERTDGRRAFHSLLFPSEKAEDN